MFYRKGGELFMEVEAMRLLMVGLTIMIGGIAPALSIGFLAAKGLEAIGRNPEAANQVQTNMILGMAFTEAIAVYALVVALIIKFV